MTLLTGTQGIKLLSLVTLVCSSLAGHLDMLPKALQPYEEWIEFIGFIGGIVQAVYIQMPRKAWSEGQRRRVKAKQADLSGGYPPLAKPLPPHPPAPQPPPDIQP